MRIRSAVMLMGLAFAVTLAAVIGLRLSAEAMAVIVGVVAGVAASIPGSLMVTWLATRYALAAPAREPQMNEPRLICNAVNSPALPTRPDAWPSPPHLSPLTTPHGASWSPRRFTGLDGPLEAALPADAPARAAIPGVSVIGGCE
jgi:hypothetical protein